MSLHDFGGSNLPPGCTNADIERAFGDGCGECAKQERISERKAELTGLWESVAIDLDKLRTELEEEGLAASYWPGALKRSHEAFCQFFEEQLETLGDNWDANDFSKERCSEHRSSREDYE